MAAKVSRVAISTVSAALAGLAMFAWLKMARAEGAGTGSVRIVSIGGDVTQACEDRTSKQSQSTARANFPPMRSRIFRQTTGSSTCYPPIPGFVLQREGPLPHKR